jgi:hypothetical protein
VPVCPEGREETYLERPISKLDGFCRGFTWDLFGFYEGSLWDL